MQTGLLWNGGQVPVIEDKLFMSIVDELREPTGKPEGKAWATRLPTSMTILQANSIGLVVKKALPCNCEEVNSKTFENPEMIPCNESFEIKYDLLGNTNSGTAKIIGSIKGANGVRAKIELKDLNGDVQYSTISDTDGNWQLIQITADNYELFIDTDNQLPEFIGDNKQQLITLEENQTLQINVKVVTP